MANLMSANLPSEDEEDQDYVPDEVDEDAKMLQRQRKPKRVRGAAAGAGVQAEDADGGGSASEGEAADEEEGVPDKKRAEKKAKVDELWSQLNRKQPAASTPGGSLNLAALSKPAAKKGKSADEAWMRQLGLGSKPKRPAAEQQQDKQGIAAAALAAAKAAAGVGGAGATVTITEQRRFAGKTIKVQRDVARDSKDAQKAATADTAAARKQAGLDSVLASLAQAKKVTVMDKSKSDWQQFKRSDDALEEELEVHKRSGDQYLDRQNFLKQAELREYEIERDRRLASDVRNRGRL